MRKVISSLFLPIFFIVAIFFLSNLISPSKKSVLFTSSFHIVPQVNANSVPPPPPPPVYQPPPPAACTSSVGVSCPPPNSSGGGGCCSPNNCVGGVCQRPCAPADTRPNQGIYGGCCGGLSLANNGYCKLCTTVGAPPSLSPNNTHVKPGPLMLTWGSAWGANGGYSVAVGYGWTYVGSDRSFPIIVPTTFRGQTVNWYVNGANACGTSDASSQADFTVCKLPSTPNLHAPSFGPLLSNGRVRTDFSWGAGNDADHYANHWYIYIDGVAHGPLTSTGYSTGSPNLPQGTCHTWHVRGNNNCNEFENSPVGSFCTPGTPTSPTPTPPNCGGSPNRPDGAPCGGSGVCCASGSCNGGVCGPPVCKADGVACGGSGASCCSGHCIANGSGTCSGPSGCKGGGEACGGSGAACCTGVCTPDGSGVCGPQPTSTPTPTQPPGYTPPPVTNTPAPTNDAWIQLQDASFQGSGGADNNPIPTGQTFITLEKGIVAGAIELGDDTRSGGPRIDTDSFDVNTESYPTQASARKRPKIITSANQIDGNDKIYVASTSGLTINTASFNAGLSDSFVVINKGGTVVINANYNSSGGAKLIIADEIDIAAGVTQIDAILVAERINFGGGATQLIINGNIATNEISGIRDLANNAVPAIKVIVKPQMYLDLLPQLSVIKVNWKKVN